MCSPVPPSKLVELPVWASDPSFLLLSLSHVQFLHFRLEEEEEELETGRTRAVNPGSSGCVQAFERIESESVSCDDNGYGYGRLSSLL